MASFSSYISSIVEDVTKRKVLSSWNYHQVKPKRRTVKILMFDQQILSEEEIETIEGVLENIFNWDFLQIRNMKGKNDKGYYNKVVVAFTENAKLPKE